MRAGRFGLRGFAMVLFVALGVPSFGASPAMSVGTGYERYPAGAYSAPSRPLSLNHDQRSFRTRLSQAYREPVNFGGSLVFTRIGCGSGCTVNYALDKASGRVFDFPLGGDDQPYLLLRFRRDSALVWASWGFGKDCQTQAWKLGGAGFAKLNEPRSIDCAEAERLLGDVTP